MNVKRIGIVGGGLAALSAAIYLAVNKNFQVEIFEKNDSIGGKLGEIISEGFRFDTGPSVVTMVDVIKDVFLSANVNPDSVLNFEQLSPVNRNFFADGSVLDTYSEMNKFADEISKISPESAKNLEKYYARIKGIYDRTADVFLFSQIHEFYYLIKSGKIPYLPDFARIDAFSSMHDVNKKYFTDKRILQLFDRYATYNGSSPYLAPGTLNLISYVELVLGAYYLKGGLIELPRALSKLAESLGVKIHLNSKVDEIITEKGTATALKINGEIEKFDYIISNSDVVYTHQHLIKGYAQIRAKLEKVEPSISGMVFLWGVGDEHHNLLHHNVFYSENYELEFDEIFSKKIAPESPTVYVAITSKSDKNHAPAGMENWFVLLNMPHIDGENQFDVQKIKQSVFTTLKKHNLDVESKIRSEKIITPQDLYERYLSNRGSIYGISSNSMFTAFKRQSNRSKIIKNLFFAGGSAHPGGGIPLVILSGKHTAEIIKRME